jgi:hypothetical protein
MIDASDWTADDLAVLAAAADRGVLSARDALTIIVAELSALVREYRRVLATLAPSDPQRAAFTDFVLDDIQAVLNDLRPARLPARAV